MSSPQEGTQISIQSVIDVQKKAIARLTEENIMLLAALSDKERQIAAMQQSQE